MPVEFNRKTKLLSPIAYFLSGSFNNSLDDSEEESDGDGLDSFVDLADSVA